MPNKRRKFSKNPLKSPFLSSTPQPSPPPPPANPRETRTEESSPPPAHNDPQPHKCPFSHRKPHLKTKKKHLSEEKPAHIKRKLSLLSQNLRPFPFAPNPQTLAPLEPLFRSLNLWGFLNLRLDLDIRADLLSELIANYDSMRRHSVVLGLRISLSRADLGRALKLPSNKIQKTSASEFDAVQFGGGGEVAAVLLGIIWNWMVFLDDEAILPVQVVTADRLVREGQPNKVDWAGLVWALVEKEILRAPENGSCYYASHLQCLMKYQKPRLFDDAAAEGMPENGSCYYASHLQCLMKYQKPRLFEDAAAEEMVQEVDRSEVVTVEEDGDAELQEVGDVGSEKCGPGLSLRIGGDGDGNKKGEEEEKVVSDGMEDVGTELGLLECGLNDTAGDSSEGEPDKEGSGNGVELCLLDRGLNLSREEPGKVGRAEGAEHSLLESELNYTARSTPPCEEPIKQEPDNGGRVEGVRHCLTDGGLSYVAGASIKEGSGKGGGGEADNKSKGVDIGLEDELAATKFPTISSESMRPPSMQRPDESHAVNDLVSCVTHILATKLSPDEFAIAMPIMYGPINIYDGLANAKKHIVMSLAAQIRSDVYVDIVTNIMGLNSPGIGFSQDRDAARSTSPCQGHRIRQGGR